MLHPQLLQLLLGHCVQQFLFFDDHLRGQLSLTVVENSFLTVRFGEFTDIRLPILHELASLLDFVPRHLR